MNIEEAKLYLKHTSKEDFNLEEWQKENRYQAIQVVLEEIERLNNIINKIEQCLIDVGVDDDILKCCGRYDVNGIEIRRYIEELKGSDKE